VAGRRQWRRVAATRGGNPLKARNGGEEGGGGGERRRRRGCAMFSQRPMPHACIVTARRSSLYRSGAAAASISKTRYGCGKTLRWQPLQTLLVRTGRLLNRWILFTYCVAAIGASAPSDDLERACAQRWLFQRLVAKRHGGQRLRCGAEGAEKKGGRRGGWQLLVRHSSRLHGAFGGAHVCITSFAWLENPAPWAVRNRVLPVAASLSGLAFCAASHRMRTAACRSFVIEKKNAALRGLLSYERREGRQLAAGRHLILK